MLLKRIVLYDIKRAAEVERWLLQSLEGRLLRSLHR